MPSVNCDIDIEQGATFIKKIVWRDSRGVARVLNGYTARMQFRQNVTSKNVLMELTTENGRISFAPDFAALFLKISADDTSAITWRRAKHDLELVAPNGDVIRLIDGDVNVSKGVTHA